MRLKGRNAVITGGAQGIGRAIALGMARAGANVVIADLQAAKAKATADDARALGVDSLAVEVDVSNESSVRRLAEQAFNRFGHVDILVNDAGIYRRALVIEMKEEDWDRTLRVNLGGNFLCSRAFVPSMRQRRFGRIISIASSIAHYGAKEGAHYAASKAAIIGFVKALARELGPDGITVNAICPAMANTAMPRGHRPEAELLQRLRSNPLGHILEADDFVGPVVFLASEAAPYVTGQTVNVNCGSIMI